MAAATDMWNRTADAYSRQRRCERSINCGTGGLLVKAGGCRVNRKGTARRTITNALISGVIFSRGGELWLPFFV